ncbi:MAG: transposase, partial [Candidatus Helarchaeota archaeon]
LHRLYKHVGRPPYSKLALFKAVLLQRLEGWQFDTTLARMLREIDEYRAFCSFKKGRVPSHDTISRFKRTLPL